MIQFPLTRGAAAEGVALSMRYRKALGRVQ